MEFSKDPLKQKVVICLLFIIAVVFLFGQQSPVSETVPEDKPPEEQVQAKESNPLVPQTMPQVTDVALARANRQPRYITNGHYILIIKSQHLLAHYFDGELQNTYPVAVGAGKGDKTENWQNMTPEGHFMANRFHDSRGWFFKQNRTPGVYGPWFIGILMEKSGSFGNKNWTGIGIHGTNNEKSIGKHVSHGCIRMKNKDITELKERVAPSIISGTVMVDIIP